MLFDKRVIENKNRYLDLILKNEDILRKVLEKFSEGKRYDYSMRKRPWNPGGGSTLFSIRIGTEKYFLKVKSASVFVESKLEEEDSFLDIPALRNEYLLLQQVKDISPNTLKFFKCVEENGFSFLFIEHLLPFREAIRNLSAKELMEVYDQIESTVRKLYEKGIVHTDIHENNIMFRGKIPVLIDFEEARHIRQNVSFEESLDVVGKNALSDVGRMPEGYGFAAGYTCLKRLREVFESMITNRLDSLIRNCNFDSSCPYLTALDHGKDERIYQSINLPNCLVSGQRPLRDNRVDFIYRIVSRLVHKPFSHIDIGSNLGRFNIEMAKRRNVKKSVGVEAYDKYVELAKIWTFLENCSNVEFVNAECGKDSLYRLLCGEEFDLITIYSVYHHINNKEFFIKDLKKLNPSYLMLEMPVQKECYEGKHWDEEVSIISEKMGMPFWYHLSFSDDYKRPIVLVSKRDVSDALVRLKNEGLSNKVKIRAIKSEDRCRVSIVLPTYNQLHFLPSALRSILSQTFSDFELIIVNDGSTDGTQKYLDGLKEPRIRVIHQDNRRLPGALNTGFREARGEYLAWVSSDNFCPPYFLQALVGALDTEPRAGLAYGDFFLVDDRGNLLKRVAVPDYGYRSLLIRNDGNAAFLYRRECMEKTGLYDTELEGAEDWDYWIRIAEHFDFVHVPDTLYYYRLHNDSMQNTMKRKVDEAAHKTLEKAIARKGGQLGLSELYPAIADCKDREEALFVAAYDFGTNLLRARVASWDMAAVFLKMAIEYKPNFLPTYVNLAIAYACSDQWNKALQTMEKVGKVKGDLAKIVDNLRDACRIKSRQALEKFPTININKQSAELFQKEKELRMVYPFTVRIGE